MSDTSGRSFTTRVVEVFLTGNLSALLVVVSLLLGAAALAVTAREEDPQIVVPMADVLLSVPGCSAEEVERQVATRLEKLLYEVAGVEHVYSMSQADRAVVTVRFHVGEDREDSLLEVHNKLAMSADRVPPQVAAWVVRPVELDDVPIFIVTLHAAGEDDHLLRRVAEELESTLKEVPDTGRTEVVGGRPQRLLVRVDPHAAAAHGVGWDQLARALQAADARSAAGHLDEVGVTHVLEAGALLRSVDEVRDLVVAVAGGAPVRLGDLAEVTLGPAEPTSYVRLGFGPAADPGDVPEALRDPARDHAAVSVAVAKRRGANAVWVADALLERLREVEPELLPDGVRWRVARNYGATADAKVDELVEGLAVALVIVIVLLALSLGWREALVVATAVPITFALTLFVNWLAGYTINRVTLFALILALGLVVDDPIIDVENIYRHLRRRGRDPLRAVLEAVNEVRPPIILATLAVIVSFLPMFFITGMMGPYMRPMALNVPLAMLMSMVVAFTITPWLSYHALKGAAGRDHAGDDPEPGPSAGHRAYGALLRPFLRGRGPRLALLGGTTLLFGLSCWLAVDRRVPLKMLPFDDKNELQVVLDLPEGTPLERTEAVAAELAGYLRRVPEVVDVTSYVGLSSPMDFNGLVRHYYLRAGSHVADLRVNLLDKHRREAQSHAVALRVRRDLQELARRSGAELKLVELPPGPPVLSTLTVEVYGRPYTSHEQLVAAAKVVERRLRQEPAVVDVDSTVDGPQPRLRFVPDREKLRLTGVSEGEVAFAVRAAVAGASVAVLHDPRDVDPTPVELRLAREERVSVDDLDAVSLVGAGGGVVRLSELGRWERGERDRAIHRKDLRRVVFVTAELAGRPPADIVLDVQADQVAPGAELAATSSPRPLGERSFARPGGGLPWSVPADVEVVWSGEGEWNITLDVFRDLGLAFLAACLGIYVLLVHETRSYAMPLILMISIPLTVIGILPGFWLLGLGAETVDGWANPTTFTATAMIGMIALSGLAVRNAILLIEFVQTGREAGLSLEDALVHAGAVRVRPILLTGGSALLAAWPITLDPIFSGLAWALIFGLVVSTAFTLVIVPVAYFMAQAPAAAAPAGEVV